MRISILIVLLTLGLNELNAQSINAPPEACVGDTVPVEIQDSDLWDPNFWLVVSPSGRVYWMATSFVADEPGRWTSVCYFKGWHPPENPCETGDSHCNALHAVHTDVKCGSEECCPGGGCDNQGVKERAKTPGLDFQLSLGSRRDGRPAGSVALRATEPSPDLAKIESLYVLPDGIDVHIKDDAYGKLQWICAPQALIECHHIDQYSYELRVYAPASPSFCQTPGTPGSARLTYLIENPNGASSYDTLRIRKFEGSTSAGTEVLSYEFVAGSPDGPWTDWTLTVRDEVADEVIRYESATWTAGTSHVLVREVRESSGGPIATLEVEEWQEPPPNDNYGRRRVSLTRGSSGNTYTKTWTYSNTSAVCSGLSR